MGAVAGIASRTSASNSKRLKYLFLITFPQVTYEAKFLQRENRFGFSREERSELGGLNRLRFLCAYVVKHGSMAKVALAEVVCFTHAN
jgi:hypothetical protein